VTGKIFYCYIEKSTLGFFHFKVSPWMDMTALNLNYVCGRTLLTSASNQALVHQVTDFSLRLLHNSSYVGSQRIFNAAQKFKRLNQQSQFSSSVHNVPSYSLNTIMKLSTVLYNSMLLYRWLDTVKWLHIFQKNFIFHMLRKRHWDREFI